MEIRTVRKPGERGTQRLVAEYGERLVCVRYRYDLARNKRYKTIELIVAEDDWRAPAPHPQEDRTRATSPETLLHPARRHPHRVPRGGIAQTDQGGRRDVGPFGTAVVCSGGRSPPVGAGAESHQAMIRYYM